jgi:hypothetical protein
MKSLFFAFKTQQATYCIDECIFRALFANIVTYVYTSELCWNAMALIFFGYV